MIMVIVALHAVGPGTHFRVVTLQARVDSRHEDIARETTAGCVRMALGTIQELVRLVAEDAVAVPPVRDLRRGVDRKPIRSALALKPARLSFNSFLAIPTRLFVQLFALRSSF